MTFFQMFIHLNAVISFSLTTLKICFYPPGMLTVCHTAQEPSYILDWTRIINSELVPTAALFVPKEYLGNAKFHSPSREEKKKKN